MLLNLRLAIIVISSLFVLILIGLFGINFVRASHCTPSFDERPAQRLLKIVLPSWCSSVSEEQSIRIETSIIFADHVDIYYWAEGEGLGPHDCHVIKTGLKGQDMGSKKVFNYLWDSTEVSDFHESMIFVELYDSTGAPIEFDWVKISIDNNLPGTPCEPPDPPDGNGNGDSPPPTSGNGSSQQTGDGGSTQTTSQTTTTQAVEEKEEKKDEEGDVEELVIEEIPISIDTFDPDIFLRGGKVSLNDVKNTSKDGTTALNFQGTAQPNKLVTLYIFTEATVAVVKSDEQGNWAYSLDKPIATGKHTAFATVNDENVTRRSNVAEFFIAKSTQEGKSLLLVKSGFQRFYPYAAALGVAVFLAISILAVYQIYNKRKVARA